jgi:hypothetical protein
MIRKKADTGLPKKFGTDLTRPNVVPETSPQAQRA